MGFEIREDMFRPSVMKAGLTRFIFWVWRDELGVLDSYSDAITRGTREMMYHA